MALILMLFSSVVLADGPRFAGVVLLLQPTVASPATRRSIARIRDELLADRFQVVLVDSSIAGEPGAIVERAAHDFDAEAILTLFGDPETGQAELWVVERSGGRVAIRRAMVEIAEPESMPEVLSTRALELLRATALELSIETTRALQPQQTPPAVAAGQPGPAPVPPPSSERGILTVDAGIAMLRSLDGPPPATVPTARIQLHLNDWLMARLGISGLGSRPRIETVYGSAELSQTIALVEVGLVFRNGKRFRPLVSVGTGLLHLSIVGIGKPPYEGREARRWSAVFDAGVGGAFALRSRVSLTAELHTFLASPHPEVRFINMRTATIGYPSFVLLLALQVEL
jgi:hypothetical protein